MALTHDGSGRDSLSGVTRRSAAPSGKSARTSVLGGENLLPCRLSHRLPGLGFGPLTFQITKDSLDLLTQESPISLYKERIRSDQHKIALRMILEGYQTSRSPAGSDGQPWEPVLREVQLGLRMRIALQASILQCLYRCLGSSAPDLEHTWKFFHEDAGEQVEVHIAYRPNPSIVETVYASNSDQDWHTKVQLHDALKRHSGYLEKCSVELYWAKIERKWAVYSFISCP
jgi:hypothetical protein